MEPLTLTPLDGRDVEETLDVVEALWLDAVEGNCEIFMSAAHYADLCSGDGLPRRGSGKVLPGMERSVQLGGEGTPHVAEFAAAAFGARLRMGSLGGRGMLADALDVRHRLPDTWARVVAREARVPWVRHLARKTRHLSPEAARKVDADLAGSVDGSMPWSRFSLRLDARIIAADPELAARREEEKRREAFAKATRSSEDGMKGFYLRAPIAVVVRFDATVTFIAEALKALGDTDDEDERRVKACLLLANPMQAVELLAAYAAHRAGTGATDGDVPLLPEDEAMAPSDHEGDEAEADTGDGDGSGSEGTATPDTDHEGKHGSGSSDPTTSLGAVLMDWPKLLPRVNVFLHLAEETVQAARDGTPDGVVRWEGEGPVTLQYVREHLAPYHAFTITPVVDLAGQEPVDAYEIPARHRRAVRLRTPADCFPFAANLDPVDIDHTQAYQHGRDRSDGQAQEQPQSRMDNYGPMGRFSHRIKTHGRWQVRQPFDGIYLWRDPQGHHYLVDHTGTRKVTQPKLRRRTWPERTARRAPLVVEIYRTGVTLDLCAA